MHESAWLAKISLGMLCILFIGTRQNALGVRVHEGSHYLLFRNRRANDVICNCLAAYWIATDTRSYRAVHWRHHQFLHEPNDPDRELYLLPENGGLVGILRLLLTDLAGITALKRLRLLFGAGREAGEPTNGSPGIHLLALAAVQGSLLIAIVSVFGALQGAIYYLVFWLLPLVTVYPFIIRLRTVTEHYSAELHLQGKRTFVSRTSLAAWLESYLIGADMEYHLEHHLIPAIPYYRLKELNRNLSQRGVFDQLGEEKAHVLSDGYLRFWRRLLFQGVEAKNENRSLPAKRC